MPESQALYTLTGIEGDNMGKVFFISDTHFNHKNIIKYAGRPQRDVEHMNKVLINNWNEYVSNKDTIYHLGDFAFNPTRELIESLNGRKRLVMGNHDKKPMKWYLDNGFEAVYDMPVIYKSFYILSHRPIYINDDMPYVNLHGHIHNAELIGGRNYKNLCVERIGYRPIEFSGIKAAMGIEGEDFDYDIVNF